MKIQNRKKAYLVLFALVLCFYSLSQVKSESKFIELETEQKLDYSLSEVSLEEINEKERSTESNEMSSLEESTSSTSSDEVMEQSDTSANNSTRTLNEAPEEEQEISENIIMGEWGTCPFTFDKKTGSLTVGAGQLGIVSEAPWQTSIIEPTDIITIELVGDIIFPEDSHRLFSIKGDDVFSRAGLSELSKFEIHGKVDMSRVGTIASMFRGAKNLKELNLSMFDTSNVSNMIYIFADMPSLIALNLSNWNTSKTSSKGVMFGANTQNIQRLSLGNEMNLQGGVALQNPCFSNGKRGERWIKEDGTSKSYSPTDFMNNYGSGDLTAGTYVAAKKYILTANSFTLFTSEIDLGSPQKLDSLIRQRASLKGVDYETDTDVTNDIKILSHDIQAKKGSYEVTFSLYDEVKTIQVNVVDAIDLIDVQLPISTEFAVLDVDDGKIISPLYKIINNSDKEVSVNISRITVISNNSGIQLLKGSDTDPTEIKNAIKLRLDYSDLDEQTSIDMVNSDKPVHLLRLNPLEHGIFSISGKYFGDYKDKKELKLKIEYAFQAVL